MLFCAILSTEIYSIMGQRMGRMDSRKIAFNFYAYKIKKKFRNHKDFGTFLVAEVCYLSYVRLGRTEELPEKIPGLEQVGDFCVFCYLSGCDPRVMGSCCPE